MVLLIDDEYDRSGVNIETIPNDDQNALRCTKSSFRSIKTLAHINPNQAYPLFKIKIQLNIFMSNLIVNY